jgi:hypothetical protein
VNERNFMDIIAVRKKIRWQFRKRSAHCPAQRIYFPVPTTPINLPVPHLPWSFVLFFPWFPLSPSHWQWLSLCHHSHFTHELPDWSHPIQDVTTNIIKSTLINFSLIFFFLKKKVTKYTVRNNFLYFFILLKYYLFTNYKFTIYPHIFFTKF